MLQFLVCRILYMIPTMIAVSVVAFIIIQLPPGDYLTSLVASLAAQGETVDPTRLDALKDRYGLGSPSMSSI